MRTIEIDRCQQDFNTTVTTSMTEKCNGASKMPSYLSVPGAVSMLGMTIGQMINESVRKFGDNEAVVVPFQNIRRTYKELNQEVDNLICGLVSLGLKRGDRLAIWSPNTYESYLTQLAGWKAGFVVVCLNAALQSGELLYAINKVGVRSVLISKRFRSQDFYDILVKSVPEILTCNKGFLKSRQAPELEFVVSVEPNLPGTTSFQHLLDIGRNNILGNQVDSNEVQFDDVCTLCFTSGTTGNPKAVMLSHHNLVNNGYIVGKRLQLQEKDRICLPVPLFHVYGCQIGCFSAMLYGATTVLPSYGYDAKAIAEVSSSELCTIVAATPTMFVDLLKVTTESNYDLSSLRSAITGGAPCPAQLVKDMKTKIGFQFVFSNYGMTEIGCTFLGLPEDSDELTATTAGYPCDSIEVKLVDKFGSIVPIGEEGELCVRGYGVTLGYYGEPDKTSEVLEQSRWFHTGDLFVMLGSGHGRVVGRIKEMINRGGENVYPREIEDFLETHPKIEQAQVFGVPDPRMGEEPAVWIHMMDGEILTSEDVKEFCRGQIAHFKIPKYILFRDNFPRTPLGKVQKFRMREETMKVLKI